MSEDKGEYDSTDAGETRWAWIRHRKNRGVVVRSGWLSKKQFQRRFISGEWQHRWDTAPQDRMPSVEDFQKFYGPEHWEEHWDWHNGSDSESESVPHPKESGVSDGVEKRASGHTRAKRKRKANIVWSPPLPVRAAKKKKKKKNRMKNQSSSSSSSSSPSPSSSSILSKKRSSARTRDDGFQTYRSRFTKHTNAIVFHQQYLLAHTSDTSNTRRGSSQRVQDTTGVAIARAHVAWAKHALRQTLLEMVETVNADLKSLPDAAFDEDGIDSELIECCKCCDSHCDDSNDILMCDGPCKRAYHMKCLTPAVKPTDIDLDPDSDWYCWQCDAVLDCIDLLNERVEEASFEDVPSFPEMRTWFYAKDVSVLSGRRPEEMELLTRDQISGILLGKRVYKRVRSNARGIDVEGKIMEILESTQELADGDIGKETGSLKSKKKDSMTTTKKKPSLSTESSSDLQNSSHGIKLRLVFVDGEVKDMTLSEVENQCRAAVETSETEKFPEKRQGSRASGNSILDMDFGSDDGNDDDGGEYVVDVSSRMGDESSSSSSSSDESSDEESGDKGNIHDGNSQIDVDDDDDEGESESDDADEDDGTRWAWLPHEGGGESGWLTEDGFKEHFGKDWRLKWDDAKKWGKMPPKEAFQEHYGPRRWKQHWEWQHNDEDEVLATSRPKRSSRSRVNYQQLLERMQEDENEEGAWDDQLDWDDIADPDFRDTEGKKDNEDTDGDSDDSNGSD